MSPGSTASAPSGYANSAANVIVFCALTGIFSKSALVSRPSPYSSVTAVSPACTPVSAPESIVSTALQSCTLPLITGSSSSLSP